ncbi:MAG: Ig domain-containing protein [Gaiellaceae bacterium]
MRLARIVVLAVVCFAVTGSTASALDLCEEPHCQPPSAEQNTPYEWEFEAEEGCVPYNFRHTNGALPPGLEVTRDGKLQGTPTQTGNFEFWVVLNDNGGPDNPACLTKGPESQAHFFMYVMPDLAVKTTSLPAATPGRPYSAQLEFTNPEAGWPVIWDITAGSLPGGLTLSEGGLISGTPAGTDAKTFTVRAREPFRRFGERELTLHVATALQASSSFRAGEVGLRYAGSVSASGGASPLSYSVAAGTLPAGLALNATTGAVRGVPRNAGTFGLTFAVTDSAGQRVTVPANLRIAARLAITTARVPAARIGTAYRARLASSGGLAPKRWRIASGVLPRGIRLDARAGVLSGTARAAGVFRFTVETRDRLGARSTRAFRLTVR